jgi:hypothetical protein
MDTAKDKGCTEIVELLRRPYHAVFPDEEGDNEK